MVAVAVGGRVSVGSGVLVKVSVGVNVRVGVKVGVKVAVGVAVGGGMMAESTWSQPDRTVAVRNISGTSNRNLFILHLQTKILSFSHDRLIKSLCRYDYFKVIFQETGSCAAARWYDDSGKIRYIR
jgi:hypothetical protein